MDSKDNNKNPASTAFERVFYRYIAWFPILILPAMVWDMMASGQHAMGVIVALIHAVLVFRFVQVVNVAGWFGKNKTAD
ncbi:hypothetical protein [Bacterioplanes sanyensis]|uniref:hypothetical protein n=1 Tax=Bacterioplanes sanyensis TaxID=1249553 RepID=UPI001E33B1A4|nr:hypothetical protein [Bacterioplanes sanyensis]